MINKIYLCFPACFGKQVCPSKLGFIVTFANYFNEMIISAVMQIRFVCETNSIYCTHPSTTGKKLLAALKQAAESMAV